MKLKIFKILILFMFVFVNYSLADESTTDTPLLVNYQGKIIRNDGTSYDGTYNIIFKIYDSATEGAVVWGAKYNVNVSNGHFNILLGSEGLVYTEVPSPPLDEVFKYPERFIEITVVDGTVAKKIEPRQQIMSAPYALSAKYVVKNGVKPESIEDGTIPIGKIDTDTRILLDETLENVDMAIEVTGGLMIFPIEKEKDVGEFIITSTGEPITFIVQGNSYWSYSPPIINNCNDISSIGSDSNIKIIDKFNGTTKVLKPHQIYMPEPGEHVYTVRVEATSEIFKGSKFMASGCYTNIATGIKLTGGRLIVFRH